MSCFQIASSLVMLVLLWMFPVTMAQESRVQSSETLAFQATEASLGLSRSDRRRIQMGLAAEGFDPGPADGLFGRVTRGAIREWQASRGGEETGYLDAGSARALLLAAGEQYEALSTAKKQPATTNRRKTEPNNEILRDKYILGLSKALKADDYPKALEFIDKLDELGGDLPPAVDYFRGESYFHTERYDEASRALNRYVAKTGKEGRYYKMSLELMLVVEEKAEAERLAEDARAKAKAEAQDKAKSAIQKEIKRLVDLIRIPYSGSGSAIKHGQYRVRYRYRYQIEIEQLSSVSIRIISTRDVRHGRYSEHGEYTTGGGYTYQIPTHGIFFSKGISQKVAGNIQSTYQLY